MTSTPNVEVTIRSARDADLDDIDDMIAHFMKGHPAQDHRRSRTNVRREHRGRGVVAAIVAGRKRGSIVIAPL